MKGDNKMMSRNYIECLKIYLGTKTNIVFDEQTIKVYIDCEIQSVLKEDDSNYILFINRNGKKYLIERDRKVPDIFEKFYREVLYYRDIMKQIVEYEKVFNDKIEYKTKIRMFGY